MKSLDTLASDIAHLEVQLDTLKALQEQAQGEADHFRKKYRDQQGEVFAWGLKAKDTLYQLVQAVEVDGKVPYEEAKKLIKAHTSLLNSPHS